MDKIVFPNGTKQIFNIKFPDGSKLTDSDRLECSMCHEKYIAGRLFDQHLKWAEENPNNVYEPQSINDFLHRECPLCKKTGRIHKISAKDLSGGMSMPNAGDVMKMYLSGEEVLEFAKGGPVIATIVGDGEIVEFKKKDKDGKDTVDRRIQICVELPGDEQRFWTPNQTSMRSLIAKFGSATEEWDGKTIELKAVEQNVSGTFKKVVYGKPTEATAKK